MTRKKKHPTPRLDAIRGELLSSGGNAEIYRIAGSNDRVVKVLTKRSDEVAVTRFLDEIDVMTGALNGTPGVITVYEADREELWYVMPLATPLMSHIVELDLGFSERVVLAAEFAILLMGIHEKGFAHRDIKPANLYLHNDLPCFGDFGLVDYPDKANVTRNGRGVGAKFTMAPEMLRNPEQADGQKADVYSLAKTVWMMITEDELGFDGQYNYDDDVCRLGQYDICRKEHLVELEDLLHDATASNPDVRPSAEEFAKRLMEYIDIHNDRDYVNLSQWNCINQRILGSQGSDSITWSGPAVIARVLNEVAQLRAANHMFFERGGLDLTGASVAQEAGCIYLRTGPFTYVGKPRRLTYEHFNDFTWDYMLLELDHLDPVLLPKDTDEYSEDLVEVGPGVYRSAQYWVYGVEDYDTGVTFPKGSKRVERYLKGSILLAYKFGAYNQIPSTYDGRHVWARPDEFRQYVEALIAAEERGENLERVPVPFAVPQPDFDWLTTPSLPGIEKWAQDNIRNFDFKNLIDNFVPTQSDSPIRYAFRYQPMIFSLRDIPFGKELALMKDGRLRLVNSRFNDPEIFYVESREDAERFLAEATRTIVSEALRGDVEYDTAEFTALNVLRPVWQWRHTPRHLFTKEEIRQLMASADDRVSNRLVIDGDGFARLIVNHNDDAAFYPLAYETWCAYHNYVGRYSTLSDLDDAYNEMSRCWEEVMANR